MEKKIVKNPYTGVICEVTEEKCKCPCHNMDGGTMMHMVACCDNGKVKIYTPLNQNALNLQDVTTWSVTEGNARLKNNRQYSQVIIGVPYDSIISPSEEWMNFEQFAQQNTFDTDAPPGDWPADCFGEIVWQFREKGLISEWETQPDTDKEPFRDFKHYQEMLSWKFDTRLFLPFKQPGKAIYKIDDKEVSEKQYFDTIYASSFLELEAKRFEIIDPKTEVGSEKMTLFDCRKSVMKSIIGSYKRDIVKHGLYLSNQKYLLESLDSAIKMVENMGHPASDKR